MSGFENNKIFSEKLKQWTFWLFVYIPTILLGFNLPFATFFDLILVTGIEDVFRYQVVCRITTGINDVFWVAGAVILVVGTVVVLFIVVGGINVIILRGGSAFVVILEIILSVVGLVGLVVEGVVNEVNLIVD